MGGHAMKARKKVESYIQSARDSFDGKPWYGTSTLYILDQVSESTINTVPEGFTKSIATLLRHMLSWKVFVIHKLKGHGDYRIPEESVANWDYKALDPAAWQELREAIKKRHTEFLLLLESISDTDLDHQVDGSVYSKEYLIRGAIQHDIFHLGQIALMMRALSN